MTEHPLPDAAAIETAVAALTAARPAYRSILGFYGPVFVAQAKAEEHTRPAEIRPDETHVRIKSEAGFALIEPDAFTVDAVAATALLETICRIAASTGEKLADAGRALSQALANGVLTDDIFDAVVVPDGRIDRLADRLQADAEMVSLLFYLAVQPSIAANARKLAGRLKGDLSDSRTCPVCGSGPILGELDSDGRRWAHCRLCWYRRPVARLGCLCCDNRDAETLHYVYSDAEPEYRLDLCAACRRYLKVVDTRPLRRIFHPPLEQVASMHLDMIAADKGYVHPMGSGNPTLSSDG